MLSTSSADAVGRRCKAAHDEVVLFTGSRKAARRKLGDELLLAKEVIPWGEWEHWLDRWGIHRNTAKRAIREAQGKVHRSDTSKRNPDNSGPLGRNENGETLRTTGATGATGASGADEEEAWWDLPQGVVSEEEDEDEEEVGSGQSAVGSGEERTEDSGLRTQDPAFGIRHSASGSALSTQSSALPGASGAQLTLDALYVTAQRSHQVVVDAAGRLLERVRDGDRAAAVALDRLASLSSVAPVSPGD